MHSFMLHKGPCTRKEEIKEEEKVEVWESWDLFREKMKPIRKWQMEQEEKAKMQSDWLMGMREIVTLNNENMVKVIDSMKVKENRTAKLVKPARVPAWTKEMTLTVYLKALEA